MASTVSSTWKPKQHVLSVQQLDNSGQHKIGGSHQLLPQKGDAPHYYRTSYWKDPASFLTATLPSFSCSKYHSAVMIERTQQQTFQCLVAALLLLFTSFSASVTGFAPTSPLSRGGGRSSAAATISPLYTTSLRAAPIPNPFRRLPWNVEREERRKARKLRLERSALHRELGIAEDATYEEIVAATDALIARAEGDIKRKIKIEVAKDKILQIRLNERLAGLTGMATTEAKAQSSFETSG